MLDPLDLQGLMSFRAEDFVHDSKHSAGGSTPDFALAAPAR